MGAEQSGELSLQGPEAAEARKRHEHYLGAYQLLYTDRQFLRPGTRVSVVRGSNAGLWGVIRPDGYSSAREAWAIDIEHTDGTLEDWWLPRTFFQIADPRAEAQASRMAERMLFSGLQRQFAEAVQECPTTISWPGMFSSASLPRNFNPYPDGTNSTRHTHRVGVGAVGYFQTLSTLSQFPVNPFFKPGKMLPVTVRHSNMSCEDDAGMDLRGLAIRFAEPGKQSPLDLMFATGPASPWWSADSLTEFAKAHMDGVPAMQAFMQKNPHSFAAYVRALKRAPQSYALLHYYTHSVYELEGEAVPRRTGSGPPHTPGHHVRFRIVPAGEHTAAHTGAAMADEPLPDRDALGPWLPTRVWPSEADAGQGEGVSYAEDYLRQELKERMSVHPVVYWLEAQVFTDDKVDEIRDQTHLNPTEFPLFPVYALEDDRGAVSHAPWVRIGEIILSEPIDDSISDSICYSVAHRPQCLHIAPTSSSADFGSVLRTRELLFPAADPPLPPSDTDGGLYKYSITFFVGDCLPRCTEEGVSCDEAQVHVQLLGRNGDSAIETKPLKLAHWATNSFRVQTTRGNQRQQLGFDEWLVCCSEDVPDISVLRITVKPVGRYTKWFLKRVDVKQEKLSEGQWSKGDEVMVCDAVALRRVFEKYGIDWKEGLARRAKQVCTVIGSKQETSPGGLPVVAVTVQFADTKRHFMYPREALQTFNPPLSFPAYHWLEEGEYMLFEATPILAKLEDDRQALNWREMLLGQRQMDFQWNTPTGSLDGGTNWGPRHRLPVGVHRAAVEPPDAAAGADTMSSLLNASPERKRATAQSARENDIGSLLEREAKDLLLRRMLTSPGDQKLTISTPNGQQHMQGVYTAVGYALERMPVWAKCDPVSGRSCAWLRSYQGRWVLTETPPDCVEPPQASIMSCDPHDGALPGDLARSQRGRGQPLWSRAAGGGRWAQDPALTVNWDARWWSPNAGDRPDTVFQAMRSALFAQGAQRDAEPLSLRPADPHDRTGAFVLGDRAWVTDTDFVRHFVSGALFLCLESYSEWQANAAAHGLVCATFSDADVAGQIPTSLLARCGGRPSIEALAAARCLYVADFSALDGLPCQPGKHVCAPTVLFVVDETGPVPLQPAVIHLSQNDEQKWVRSACSPTDWAAAKICVMSAAAHVQFFVHRILYCHLVCESFAVAALRNLADQHPLYKLLHPHIKKVLTAAAQAREMCAPDSPVLRAFALTADGVAMLQERMFGRWRLDTCNSFQHNITSRGVGELPGFAYRDQVCDMWDVIQGYVQDVLTATYVCSFNEDPTAPSDSLMRQLADDVVSDDPEVSGFLTELARSLRRQSWLHLFSDESARGAGLQDMVDICTPFIWTVSVLHTSLTHTFWDSFGWPAAAPLALHSEIPSPPSAPGARDRHGHDASLDSLFGLLPTRPLTAYQVVLAWLLSRGAQMVDLEAAKRHADVLDHPTEAGGGTLPFGWWNEDLLVLPELKSCVKRLRHTLEQVSLRLQSVRPPGAAPRHPDVFPVDPRMIPNSLLPVSKRLHPSEDRLPGNSSSFPLHTRR
eukprot:TRINITY_DN21401_c0_g1_i1.p1 TRINITY_DN21401_c0_g1~~TRINITY_DN21401_c0_g1_i1.p1  ORF type:complete len:1546 (+),score=131.40 TRINITY_DN21401_c0_g1_i1:69-4706(+)